MGYGIGLDMGYEMILAEQRIKIRWYYMGGGYASLVRGNFRGSRIDRVGAGLCFVAFIKKPLCDNPVKGWNH
jgi:hypothetical protein